MIVKATPSWKFVLEMFRLQGSKQILVTCSFALQGIDMDMESSDTPIVNELCDLNIRAIHLCHSFL